MKIALLLPGLTRSAILCYDNLYKHFLSKYDKVDIYIHTWDIPSESSILEIQKLYKPKKISYEFYDLSVPIFTDKISKYNCHRNTTPDRSISAFYKIKKVFDLVDEEYDIYVKSRLDVMLEDDLVLEDKLSTNTIYIPSHIDKKTVFENGYYKSYADDGYGIIDAIAVSDYKSMKTYCSVYDNLDKLCLEKGLDFHPEFLTLQNILMNNISISRFYLDYYLYRKPN